MNEVSCKAFWLWFEVAKQRGIDPARYVEGLPVSLQHISNSGNRVDWDVFVSLIDRLEALVGGPKELETVSQVFAQAPSVKGVRSALSIVTSPRAMYWAVHRWFGHALFTIVESTFHDVGPNEIEMQLKIPPGFRPSGAFLRMNAGVFRANPRALDLPDANVEFNGDERLGTYRIRLPLSMTLYARIKRAFTIFLGAGAAFQELGSQQEEIKQKYFQLNDANLALEKERNTIQLLLELSQAATEVRTVDEVVKSITSELSERLAFARVDTVVDTEQDGVTVRAEASKGQASDALEMTELPIRHGDRTLGRVRVGISGRAIKPDELRLVERMVEVVGNAVDNAIAYTVIKSYRHELEDRVVERTAQLGSALDELKHQQAARQRIFQNISHELRTPLSLIALSASDVLYREGEALSEKSRERLDHIDDSIQRLLHLFDGMLLLAAGQEGKLRIRPKQVDAASMLAQLAAAWQVAAEKHSIHLHYRGPERLSVRVDQQGVERMVSNLLSNAIKFTPQGGSIEVRLEEQGDRFRIAVQDSGVGMDQEFLGRVFGRFEQGPAPVRVGERGSGIGLAIVKEIAEAHGGTATVESERGRGSTFVIALPKEQDMARLAALGDGSFIPGIGQPPGVREREVGKTTVEAKPEGKAATHTVLVAEDDPSLRQFLVELLSREYRVVAAADGLGALRLAKEHHPALLVSDIGMPGIDGIELTRRFRAESGDKLAPVILLTAYAMVETRLQGLEAGAIDYVTKPFHPEELLSRIKGQLTLRDMAMRLHESQKLAGLGILSAGLAHELRNPANGVVNAIGPLKKMLPKEVLEPGTPTALLLDAMTHGADQIAVLTRQLLGFSRQGELDVREEALTRVLDSAEALVEPTMQGRRIRRDLQYTDKVRCARGLVVQVLVNLLENAAHASPPGSEIVLSTHLENGFIMFDVRDAGPGVPKDMRERIFDPFFTTKDPGKGTGLGLTISKMIAERHGGNLRLLEGETGGAFRLELPAARIALPTTSALLQQPTLGGRS
ncbi:MAG: response regulator [Archangiaceae bacterium]|nr:response regulator [Archangiaceae bacterium]